MQSVSNFSEILLSKINHAHCIKFLQHGWWIFLNEFLLKPSQVAIFATLFAVAYGGGLTGYRYGLFLLPS
jgi:hypothetical protein